MKVFLGGTCNGSKWREELIPMLTVDYFNPVVEDWTPECQAEEIQQRQKCDFVLYAITSDMTGVYSIAEVIDDSNKRPEKTLFCVLEDGFTEGQVKSLKATAKMIETNGGKVFNELREVARYMHNELGRREEHSRQMLLRG